MPPNVKENAAVVDSLATLNVKDIVESKYLPLTQQQQHTTTNDKEKQDDDFIEAPHVSDATHPAASYWDWPSKEEVVNKDEMISRILEEERARQILSADHVHETLTKDANKEEEELEYVTNSVGDEDYWNMPSNVKDESVPSVTAAHVSDHTHPKHEYWDWPSRSKQEEKQALIQRILKAEEIRQMLSIQHVECNLLAQSQLKAEQPAVCATASNQDASYWDW